MTRGLIGHVALALLAVALYATMHGIVGRIPVNDGEGWDGIDYAYMMRFGWATGSVFSRLRPLVVWMNQPAFALTGNPTAAFDLMNYVYAGAFALLLSLLMHRYGASGLARAVAILCLGLSNALRLPVFYPVLIDLGACVFMALAIWLILTGPRWAAAAGCVAAVLAREFAPVVIFFGVHRDLRLRVPIRTIIATYAPASLVYVVLRVVVAQISRTPGNNLAVFIGNVTLWKDPMFVALYGYFALTFLGGMSLITAAQVRRCWHWLRQEPEWISYVLPIAGVSALVGPDIWRYFVCLAPVVLVFYARCSQEWSRGERVVWPLAALGLTIWTQEPYARIDLAGYFTDWFPYYAWRNIAPSGVFPNPLWPDWAWRFLVVVLSFCTLIVYASGRQPVRVVTRS